MDKRLVLHVGMNKTGSTAIQSSLYRAELPQGYCYPDFGDANHTFGLIDAFAEDPVQVRWDINRPIPTESIKRRNALIRQVLEVQCTKKHTDVIVISAEGFQRLGKAGFVEFRRFFDSFGFRIEGYAYIRPPSDFLPANFQEHLKFSNVRFSDVEKMLDFGSWVRRHDEFFDSDEFTLVKYDRDAFPGGNVVFDFLQRIGLDGLKPVKTLSNRSLSLPAVRLLYLYRNQQEASDIKHLDPARTSRLVAALSEIRGPRFEFGYHVISRIIEQRRNVLERIERRIGSNLMEVRISDPVAAVDSEMDLSHHDPLAEVWLRERMKILDQPASTIRDWPDWVYEQMQALYSKV